MKTYDDLEEIEKSKLTSLIDATESFEDRLFSSTSNKEAYGQCASCRNFQIVESEFKTLVARCEELELRLSTANPVKNCSIYRRRGEMTLWEMKDVAIIIDIPKDKIGF